MASDAATRGVPCPAAGLPPRRSPATSGLDGTLSRIGANPVMRLGLRIDGAVRQRNVLVPIQHASIPRPGATLPVRIDRADNRLLVVDWAALDRPPGRRSYRDPLLDPGQGVGPRFNSRGGRTWSCRAVTTGVPDLTQPAGGFGGAFLFEVGRSGRVGVNISGAILRIKPWTSPMADCLSSLAEILGLVSFRHAARSRGD